MPVARVAVQKKSEHQVGNGAEGEGSKRHTHLPATKAPLYRASDSMRIYGEEGREARQQGVKHSTSCQTALVVVAVPTST